MHTRSALTHLLGLGVSVLPALSAHRLHAQSEAVVANEQGQGYEVVYDSGGSATFEGATWLAANPAQRMITFFEPAGIRVMPPFGGEGSWQWGLDLVSAGRRGSLLPVAAAVLSSRGNRMEYDRGQLVEWYLNTEEGLEQGFTLLESPDGVISVDGNERARPVLLEMEVVGSLGGELAQTARSAQFLTSAGQRVLTYSRLEVWDAEETDLSCWLEMSADGRRLFICVDDRDAVYPVTIDPLVVTQQQKLVASDAAAGDQFGYSGAAQK